MVGHRAYRRSRQPHRIVAEHQCVHGRVAGGAVARAGLDETPDAVVPRQAIEKAVVRLVQLERLRTLWVASTVEQQLEIEYPVHGGTALLPLAQHRFQNLGHALADEGAHVPAPAHQGHGVTDHEPVTRERAIGLAGLYVRDDPVDRVQHALVRRQLD